MSDKSATKTPLLVKKSDSKKGSLWHDFAHSRIIKQHGGDEIPEGDLHAIHKPENPVLGQKSTPEETNAVLSDLEKEIQELKQKDNQQMKPSKPPQDFEEFLNDKITQHATDQDDETF